MTDYPWHEKISKELENAQIARAQGNEGMARVCARRAAGAAIGVYLELNHMPDPGPSAIDRLLYLNALSDIPPASRQSIEYLTQRVNEDFELTSNADLIVEAQKLITTLLPNYQKPKD